MKNVLERVSAVVGAKYCLSGPDPREKYDHDITGAYKSRSLAVVRPADTREVADVLKIAHAARVPVVPLGGNTGLAGGGFAGTAGDKIILSLDRMNQIREINVQSQLAIVQAGVVLADLHLAAEERGLIFPLMFGARGSCLVGGNLATNAGGSNVVRYGNTRALCLGLEVVTAEGEILDLMSELRKDNTGYCLKDLFIGSEGTLGIITGAVLKLFPKPAGYATAMVSAADIPAALDLLNALQVATGGAVEAFEYMPKNYFRHLRMIDPSAPMPFDEPAETGILVEIAATDQQRGRPGDSGRAPITALLEDTLEAELETGGVLTAIVAQTDAQRAEFWRQREMAFEVSTHLGVPITADVSLPLDRVDTFLSRMNDRLKSVAPRAEVVPIAHLGDGNVHYSFWIDPDDREPLSDETKTRFYSLVEDVVADLGGSFSAEHGIGLLKLGSMARRKDPGALRIMKKIKQTLDPENIMNPGKTLP